MTYSINIIRIYDGPQNPQYDGPPNVWVGMCNSYRVRFLSSHIVGSCITSTVVQRGVFAPLLYLLLYICLIITIQLLLLRLQWDVVIPPNAPPMYQLLKGQMHFLTVCFILCICDAFDVSFLAPSWPVSSHQLWPLLIHLRQVLPPCTGFHLLPFAYPSKKPIVCFMRCLCAPILIPEGTFPSFSFGPVFHHCCAHIDNGAPVHLA